MKSYPDRIATVKKTSEILGNFSVHAKKNFGQNFMVSPVIPERIANHPKITANTLVIEVGPGLGALTEFLLEKAKKVICYEIDKTLIPVLNDNFKDKNNFEIINADFLKVNIDEIQMEDYSNVIVVSNLPYYITSEILIKILSSTLKIDIIAMMQKEVAQRILKAKGGEENELSLASKYYSNVSKWCEVSKNDFFPKPHIDSTVLFFEKKEIDKKIDFMKWIRILMNQRRKTISNNLKGIISDKIRDDIYTSLNISPIARIDELSYGTIVDLIMKLDEVSTNEK